MILVMDGGWTCSLRASSPGVALPHRASVPSTPISVGLSDSSTRWCRNRRAKRIADDRSWLTATRSSSDISGMSLAYVITKAKEN